MSRIFFTLLLAIAWLDAHAQSSLPSCPTNKSVIWTNCVGIYTYASGAEYAGEWKDGKRDGWGVQVSRDGSHYDGEWKDDKFNGLGTFELPHDMKYVGEWKDGKMNGQGTMTYADGKKYVGEWSDGKKNGKGAFFWPDGAKYVGDWRDNERYGQATHSWADGKKYVGEYKDDNRSYGKIISAQGYTIAEGIWIDDLTVIFSGTQWTIVTDERFGTSFVSSQSIRQEGPFRRAWVIHANHEPDPETRWLSARALFNFDCAKERNQKITETTHSGPFGSGQILSSSGESDWQYVPPTTVLFGLMNYVCNYKLTPKR